MNPQIERERKRIRNDIRMKMILFAIAVILWFIIFAQGCATSKYPSKKFKNHCNVRMVG